NLTPEIVSEIQKLSDQTQSTHLSAPAHRLEYAHASQYLQAILANNSNNLAALETELIRFSRVRHAQFNKTQSPITATYNTLKRHKILSNDKQTQEEALMAEVLNAFFNAENNP